MKALQLVDAGNLCVSGSSIDRTFFSLFPEFEDLVGNLVVKVLQEVNQHKLTIQLRLLKIINDTASQNYFSQAKCQPYSGYILIFQVPAGRVLLSYLKSFLFCRESLLRQ